MESKEENSEMKEENIYIFDEENHFKILDDKPWIKE
jgi:hypothetical protein